MPLGVPILLGRTIPLVGDVIDFGEQIDYLVVKNKSSQCAIMIGFSAPPVPGAGYTIAPTLGFDMGGLNIRHLYVMPVPPAPPPPLDPVEVDFLGVATRLLSLDSTKGGSVRACNLYPFMIQLSEPFSARRKIDTIPIPQRGLYTDWGQTEGGDGGNDPPPPY